MRFKEFGSAANPKLLLIHGLEISWKIFSPIVEALQHKYHIITPMLDGHIVDDDVVQKSTFTTVDDQAQQICRHLKEKGCDALRCAYGISLGGSILARIAELGSLRISRAIIDAAPILPINALAAKILTYYQACNVWCTYHFHGLYRLLFRRSHYFTASINEVKKVYPAGGIRTIINAYRSVFFHRLREPKADKLYYWYGKEEAFMFKRCADYIVSLNPNTKVEIFPKMAHAQLLIDHPEEVARRIETIDNQ